MYKGTIKNCMEKVGDPDGSGNALQNGSKEALKKSCGKPPARPMNQTKSKRHACIVEAHESTRKCLESTLPRDHEDGIAETGRNSISHYHFCAQV